VAPIVTSIDISRAPEDVFTYVTDPRKLAEWQESLVSTEVEGEGPPAAGTRVKTIRRVGSRTMTMTMELTEIDPPRSWSGRGLDGPVRGVVSGSVEPLDEGARSRVTINLDFTGHGIGKLLVPLVVRRQAQREMPRNMQNLKERLEAG
jgi:uncharacterized protein YndB with AHSA1/START domain